MYIYIYTGISLLFRYVKMGDSKMGGFLLVSLITSPNREYIWCMHEHIYIYIYMIYACIHARIIFRKFMYHVYIYIYV